MSQKRIKPHNEYIMSISPKHTCPTCHAKAGRGEKLELWSWGEYHNVRWYSIKHFCKECFDGQVKQPLLDHAGPCGCVINLTPRGGGSLPKWMVL